MQVTTDLLQETNLYFFIPTYKSKKEQAELELMITPVATTVCYH